MIAHRWRQALKDVGDQALMRGLDTAVPNPRQLMSYLGLVPSERSTGASVRRGGIIKAGNSRVRHMLVESAWTYRHAPRIDVKKLYLHERVSPVVREIA